MSTFILSTAAGIAGKVSKAILRNGLSLKDKEGSLKIGSVLKERKSISFGDHIKDALSSLFMGAAVTSAVALAGIPLMSAAGIGLALGGTALADATGELTYAWKKLQKKHIEKETIAPAIEAMKARRQKTIDFSDVVGWDIIQNASSSEKIEETVKKRMAQHIKEHPDGHRYHNKLCEKRDACLDAKKSYAEKKEAYFKFELIMKQHVICEKPRLETMAQLHSLDKLSKLQGKAVEEYHRTHKGNKKGNKHDQRPEKFEKIEACHGTKFSTVMSSILFSNKQLIPGVKARKLGIGLKSGENNGVTPFNSKHVSVVQIGAKGNRDHDDPFAATLGTVFKYSKLKNERDKEDIFSDIPTVIFGDKHPDDKYEYVASSCTGEHQCKRLNIRMVAVPQDKIHIVLEAFKLQDVKDIRVVSLESLEKKEAKVEAWRKACFKKVTGKDKIIKAAAEKPLKELFDIDQIYQDAIIPT